MNNIKYIYAKIAAGGSVYLSEIFDHFDAEMSEDDYNSCFSVKNGQTPRFSYQHMDDEIKILVVY